jgi:mono/diheme cytochrome c family protein
MRLPEIRQFPEEPPFLGPFEPGMCLAMGPAEVPMQINSGGRMMLGVASLMAALSAATLTGMQNGGDSVVTAVSGPSWLNQLGIAYRDTGLGRTSPTYGPPAEAAGSSSTAAPVALPLDQRVSITGEDLYRYSCRACHGPRGSGAPPEIKSLLPLVAQGKKSQADLYKRIHTGGQRMPSREQLTDADVAVLYGYLNQLAGQPAAAPRPLTVTWPRLGELVVKGTCHICHDAVGPRPGGRAYVDGAIPPMNILLRDKSVVGFVEKVRHGAPVLMGDVPFHYRGRMPVFTYLRDQEVAAAYLYLMTYPPAEAPSAKK